MVPLPISERRSVGCLRQDALLIIVAVRAIMLGAVREGGVGSLPEWLACTELEEFIWSAGLGEFAML
jgi:hypothetical protein